MKESFHLSDEVTAPKQASKPTERQANRQSIDQAGTISVDLLKAMQVTPALKRPRHLADRRIARPPCAHSVRGAS